MQRDIFGTQDDSAVIARDGFVNIKAEPEISSLGNYMDSYPVKRKYEEFEELGSETKKSFSENQELYKFPSFQNRKTAYKDRTEDHNSTAWPPLSNFDSLANLNTSTNDITNSLFVSNNNFADEFVPQFATQYGFDLDLNTPFNLDFKIIDEFNEEKNSIHPLEREEREKTIEQRGNQKIENMQDYCQKPNASCLRPILPKFPNSENASFPGSLPSLSSITSHSSNTLPKLEQPYEPILPLTFSQKQPYSASTNCDYIPDQSIDDYLARLELHTGISSSSYPAFSTLSSLPAPSSDTWMEKFALGNLKVELNDSLDALSGACNGATAFQASTSNDISKMTVNAVNAPSETNEVWTPLERPLNQTQTEQELRNLLESIPADDPPGPEERKGTPDGLKPNLMEHQKVGVGWMIEHEAKTTKGGILADDMGLGKTIQSLALILSNRSPDKHCKTTLIVTSVALAHQWAKELETKTEKNVLKVCVYHGQKRNKNPKVIVNYDVVITTYATVSQEYNHDVYKEVENAEHGSLFKCSFYRVILDEAQTIKNRSTRSARACCAIDAAYRWCLSATPIQNNITELFSMIKFLRIRPYCEWEKFKNEIEKPMKSGRHKQAMKRVQILLKAIMLRRTKKCKLDGLPILQLPERNVNMVHTPFAQEQREFYDQVEAKTRIKFNKYLKNGTVANHYSNILVLLLRLRQICNHPKLIKHTMQPEKEFDENQICIAKSIPEPIVKRLLDDEVEEGECSICMDSANDAVLVYHCGHIYCRECLMSYTNHRPADEKACPECRGPLDFSKLVSLETFNHVYREPVIVIDSEPVQALPEANDHGETILDGDKMETQSNYEEWVSSSKTEKIIEVLAAIKEKKYGEKTVLFSQFTGFIDLLEKPLKNAGLKFLRYVGSMDINKRVETVEKFFQDKEVAVMLVSMKCGSLGLNLTCANHVILADPWWNPALDNQAIDRVHRIGQTKDVEVHRILVPNTVEDRIMSLQEKKQKIADDALGEGDSTKIGKLGLNDLIFLFTGNNE